MTGKNPIRQFIEPDEAMKLFHYACIEEMHIVKDLHDTYRTQRGRGNDSLWDMLSLLTFVYDTGRVQGIREERAKKAPERRVTEAFHCAMGE